MDCRVKPVKLGMMARQHERESLYFLNPAKGASHDFVERRPSSATVLRNSCQEAI
jgi:hypothetical protein